MRAEPFTTGQQRGTASSPRPPPAAPLAHVSSVLRRVTPAPLLVPPPGHAALPSSFGVLWRRLSALRPAAGVLSALENCVGEEADGRLRISLLFIIASSLMSYAS